VRYVVLRHDGISEPHFDVMIEAAPGGALHTWRVPSWPPRGGEVFERLPDHRRDYLDYEGPVSGNRGTVRRVEAGVCEARPGDGRLWVGLPSGLELSLATR
jgi:hypothetical protein